MRPVGQRVWCFVNCEGVGVAFSCAGNLTELGIKVSRCDFDLLHSLLLGSLLLNLQREASTYGC